MKILFIDCDGVTFNTEVFAFHEMKRLGVNLKNSLEITNFFGSFDWNILFSVGGILNNSVSRIKNLLSTNTFLKIYALSAYSLFNGKYISNEIEVKKKNYQKYLPEVELIPVPITTPKHEYVKDMVKGNILVDNSLKNILGWQKNGGYGVFFVQSLKTSYPTFKDIVKPYQLGANQPYFIIDDLKNLEKVNDLILESEVNNSYLGDDFVIKDILSIDSEAFLESKYIKELQALNDEDKIYFFSDYDGVIFDTHTTALGYINQLLKLKQKEDQKQGIFKDDSYYLINKIKRDSIWNDIIDDYFLNVDWKDLINESKEIDNARSQLLKLKNLNIFKSVAVASNRNTYENEGMAKFSSLKEYDINCFTIPVKIKKSEALPSRNSILLDDSIEKVRDWVNNSGIGILFLKYHPLTLPTEDKPYFIVGNILDVSKVLYLKNYLKTKKLLKK